MNLNILYEIKSAQMRNYSKNITYETYCEIAFLAIKGFWIIYFHFAILLSRQRFFYLILAYCFTQKKIKYFPT